MAKIRICTDGVGQCDLTKTYTQTHAYRSGALTWANTARLARYHALIKFTGAYACFGRVLYIYTNSNQHFIISVSHVRLSLSLSFCIFKCAAHLSPECRSRVCRLTRADITADFFSLPTSVALLYFLSFRFRFVCPSLMPFVPFVIAFISRWCPVFFSSRCCSLFLSNLSFSNLFPFSSFAYCCFDIFFSDYNRGYQWEYFCCLKFENISLFVIYFSLLSFSFIIFSSRVLFNILIFYS